MSSGGPSPAWRAGLPVEGPGAGAGGEPADGVADPVGFFGNITVNSFHNSLARALASVAAAIAPAPENSAQVFATSGVSPARKHSQPAAA